MTRAHLCRKRCYGDTPQCLAPPISRMGELELNTFKMPPKAWILRLLDSFLCFWSGPLSIKYPSVARMAIHGGWPVRGRYGNRQNRDFVIFLFFFFQTTYRLTGTCRSSGHDSLTKPLRSPMRSAFSQNQHRI